MMVNPRSESKHLISDNPNNHDTSVPISAADLMQMEFPPTEWIVPDVLPEGVTLLAGKPKMGKSWMTLGLAEAVASGGVTLGRQIKQGDVLYLALEDNLRRLQKRLGKILDGRSAPSRIEAHITWPRLPEGGTEKIDAWLFNHPEARLIVIDTLAKVRPLGKGQNIYHQDYSALEELVSVSAHYGVAIVVVHHLRKQSASDPADEISGSTGLQGGVDGMMILRRAPGSKGPTLFVEGRDIEKPTEYALAWNPDTATWTIEGDAEEVHISKERQAILNVLGQSPDPMKPKEVAEALNAKPNNVKQTMFKMLEADQLIKDNEGNYFLPPLTLVT